ncbi:MAG: POTRA domain-containing protein [Salibacteraceae bacterium]
MRLLRQLLTPALICAAYIAAAQVVLTDKPKISYSNPKTYEIGGVSVEGAENLDEGAIRLLSGLAVGTEIEVPGEATSKALKSLWKQDLFSDVQLLAERIEGNKIYLIIRIKERPRLSRFRFVGVTKSEADDLREQINLYKEKIVTENLLVSTQQKVYKFYADKGYRAAVVEVKQEPDSLFRNRILLTIDVDKGKKVKISHINFKGNKYFSDYQLRKFMKETKEHSVFKPFADLDTLGNNMWYLLWNDYRRIPKSLFTYTSEHVKIKIFKSSKLIKTNYEEDKEIIIARYHQKGFRDARIVHDSIYNISPYRLGIDITIDEGRQYYFRNIKWIGNSKYSSDRLSNQLGIKKGDIYDPQKLESRLYMDQSGGDISSLYMDNGYLFFQLEPVEILAGEDSIDLEIRIYEGEQARINAVSVSGNTKTNDHVILRELHTLPGQLFSRADIIRSQRELTVLGFFDPEAMNVIPTPDPASGTVDIEYVVAEKPNDQLMLQGGYGQGFLMATVGIQFNNFSTRNLFRPKEWNGPLPTGDGQKLNLSVNTSGRTYQQVSLGFSEPWLGGKKPTSLSMNAYYSFIGDGNKKYNETASGPQLRLSRYFFERLGFTSQIGTRLNWPDNYFSGFVEATAEQFTLQNYPQLFVETGQFYNLYIRLALRRSSVDDNIFPTMGSDMNFSVQLTPPYSLFNNVDYDAVTLAQRFKFLEYHKWKFTWAYYTGIAGKQKKHKLVLYTKVGFGMLGFYNRQVGMIPFERFFLGGDMFSGNLNQLDGREIIGLRGYDSSGGLSPRNGATLINKYTAELRYPFMLSPGASIFGLGFMEAGNSWSNFNQFNPLEVYKSTGLGIRIFLPMFGLLGVDWAYRLDNTQGRTDFNPNANLQRSRFHFTLGYQLGDL